MKAVEQYFSAVLFILLYKVFLTVESVDEILKCDHSNESYGASLCSGAVCYAIQAVLTVESVVEILTCDYLNESYRAVLFCGAVYFAARRVSNCWRSLWVKS